jgi:hypothetical protein
MLICVYTHPVRRENVITILGACDCSSGGRVLWVVAEGYGEFWFGAIRAQRPTTSERRHGV